VILSSARLVLVRHGQSTYNASGHLQGQTDTALSDAGRAEAEALRPFLPHFEQVVTSDLVRASETAALLGHPDARQDARWREIDLGGWAGRPIADFPDEHEGAWRGGPLHAPDGESWVRFVTRVGGAVDELAAAGRDWLVVCHGGTIRAALSHITGADPRTVIGPANTSVTVLRPPFVERYAWTPAL
jgi:glucosyl-3-phosphoglycerate phosphatase